MTQFMLAHDVCEAFPDTRIALVTASGMRPDEPWPSVDDAVTALERRCTEHAWAPPGDEDPRISAWHEAYRRFGANPRRIRPSVDALCRRLARTGRLPRISGAVDCYNLVSVTHVFPAGAFDLERVSGDVMIRFGHAADRFTPLGEPEVTETPGASEVVYADQQSVLTRYWNHRDADHTKITAASTCAAFILETLDAGRFGSALANAAGQLAGFVRSHAAATQTLFLDPGCRKVALPDLCHDPAGPI